MSTFREVVNNYESKKCDHCGESIAHGESVILNELRCGQAMMPCYHRRCANHAIKEDLEELQKLLRSIGEYAGLPIERRAELALNEIREMSIEATQKAAKSPKLTASYDAGEANGLYKALIVCEGRLETL